MKFDEAFERLQKMADGRRCVLSYQRSSDPDLGVYPSIYCIVGEGEVSYITKSYERFESVLVGMAAILAGQIDEPEIEGCLRRPKKVSCERGEECYGK